MLAVYELRSINYVGKRINITGAVFVGCRMQEQIVHTMPGRLSRKRLGMICVFML